MMAKNSQMNQTNQPSVALKNAVNKILITNPEIEMKYLNSIADKPSNDN